MKKIVLLSVLCVMAFGFDPLGLVFGAPEKRSGLNYGAAIEGGVAIGEVMKKAKGSYIDKSTASYAAHTLLNDQKNATPKKVSPADAFAEAFLLQAMGVSILSKKEALQTLNNGCYNYDKYMSKAAAQQYYTAMSTIGEKGDLMTLAALADPKTRKSVKMIGIKDEQIISDKIDVIVASCSGLAMYYKKNGNKKKANELVNIGAKNACSFAISKESKTECEAKTKEGLTELLNEMP